MGEIEIYYIELAQKYVSFIDNIVKYFDKRPFLVGFLKLGNRVCSFCRLS